MPARWPARSRSASSTGRSGSGADSGASTPRAANYVWGEAPDITAARRRRSRRARPGRPAPARTRACASTSFATSARRQSAADDLRPARRRHRARACRATATAEVLFGNSTDCVKPLAIPDKWIEGDVRPPAGSDGDTFDRYDADGRSAGAAAAQPTTTQPPSAPTRARTQRLEHVGSVGRLRHSAHAEAPCRSASCTPIAPGWFYPGRRSMPATAAAATAIGTTSPAAPRRDRSGDVIACNVEPGNMIGPTSAGLGDLIAARSGRPAGTRRRTADSGGVVGGCMASRQPARSARGSWPCRSSTRTSDDAGNAERPHRHHRSRKILGFFIESMSGNDVVGRPDVAIQPTPRFDRRAGARPAASFVVSIALVR